MYTRSRHEKKAVIQLAELDVEQYLPITRRIQRWKDRKREVEFPLFPGYLFVRVDMEEEAWSSIRRDILGIPGIVNFVGFQGDQDPVSVPEREINAIRTVLERKFRTDPWKYTFKPGQTVTIRSGPLSGVEGVVVRRKGVARLVLYVHLISQAVAVEIGPEDLQA
jgi:transcription antitermination factor NusG